ncbi:GntR family transcriptional regulator [Amycolatopsis sp. GM8]|uniref:GntR family transcriptional regulator n=1 Tax=Amycolatopsis sp. GM8 TaxID=2896530 RepID=UPI001F19A566|nr:GntR family transcriptional regulator [Amycolatopsis sp. GM8]
MSQPESRADRVADELRRAIIARVYTPGERLAAQALAQRFQVSETPLREAFARLAGEGWVTYLPQRGVRVADLSMSELAEVYELREQLEPLAVRKATEKRSDAGVESVRRAFEEMTRAAASESRKPTDDTHSAYEVAHDRFHRTLVAECDSAILLRFTTILMDQSTRYRRLSLPVRKRSILQGEHQRIRDAVLAGDPEEAAKASLDHMHNTKFAIIDWLATPSAQELAPENDG